MGPVWGSGNGSPGVGTGGPGIPARAGSPVLGAALATGLIIGILQAATSIQEMTLSFIPKLAVMALALAIFGEWQIAILIDYFETVFERIRTMTL